MFFFLKGDKWCIKIHISLNIEEWNEVKKKEIKNLALVNPSYNLVNQGSAKPRSIFCQTRSPDYETGII